MTSLSLQLIASIVIPKQHHSLMRKSKTYAKNVLAIYERQIKRFINQMESK